MHRNDLDGTGSCMTQRNGVRDTLALLACGKWKNQSLTLVKEKGSMENFFCGMQ
jgi:hypothetical protein